MEETFVERSLGNRRKVQGGSHAQVSRSLKTSHDAAHFSFALRQKDVRMRLGWLSGDLVKGGIDHDGVQRHVGLADAADHILPIVDTHQNAAHTCPVLCLSRDKRGLYAVGHESRVQEVAELILTDASNQADVSAETASRDGLVEPLAPRENMKSLAEDRLTRNRKVGYLGNVIDVEAPLHEHSRHNPSLADIWDSRVSGIVGRRVPWQ